MHIKKHLKFAVVLGFTCLNNCVLCQSTFVIDNFAGGAVDAPVFDADGNRLFGAHYLALLYGGPTPLMLRPATIPPSTFLVRDPVPFTYTPGGQAGYFRDRTGQVGSEMCGGVAWLQVRAWDSRLGASYEDVVELGLGGYGESNIFQKQGGNPCGPITPPELLIGLESFSLLPVIPEPRPMLLLLLGLPLLLFRRRFRGIRTLLQPTQPTMSPMPIRGQTEMRK
jgi:hypothetical protein